MTEQPTVLSLLAAGLYVAVAIACMAAFASARRHDQRTWYGVAWLAMGATYLCLAASRIFGLEDQFEGMLRIWMFADGGYLQRANVQRPVAVAAAALGAVCAFAFGYLARRHVRGKREIALAVAVTASFAMVGLVVMRLISLHSIDWLLYGPLKLNWLADIGLSGLVACCAGYFIWLVSGRVTRSR